MVPAVYTTSNTSNPSHDLAVSQETTIPLTSSRMKAPDMPDLDYARPTALHRGEPRPVATSRDSVWYAPQMTDSDLPDRPFERAQMLQNLLIARATGGPGDEATYQALRRYFFDDPAIKPLLPEFIRTSRDLSQFWGYIKPAADNYQLRREIIWEAFQPLLDHLEAGHRSPSDLTITDALNFLQADKVTEAWQKAIARRHTDPDGAITTARQLLESVCKTILDDLKIDYPADADLPKLWALSSQRLTSLRPFTRKSPSRAS